LADAALTTAPWRISFDRTAQVKAGVVAVAFVTLFWGLLGFVPGALGDLVSRWVNESDWSHGPIIPLFSAYLVYMRWDQIRRTPIRYAWLGLPVLVGGVLFYLYTLFGLQFGYLRQLSMLVVLLGVIILLCGLAILRHVWIPYLYLLFAFPLPQRLYFEITNPLRRLAASFATTVLSAVYAPELQIERSGSMIEALYQGQYHAIGVADACSGMRSTITLCALGVAIAFISDRPAWQRVVMVLACLPIATFCNFIRVLITCWLFIFVDERYATGNYHQALALVMLGLAFLIFSGLAWVLRHLVVEEPAEAEADRGSAG